MAQSNKYGEVTVERDSAANPLNGSAEPVFVLRASDASAAMMLGAYQGFHTAAVGEAMRTSEDGQAPLELVAHVQSVSRAVAQFNAWREANPHLVDRAD